MTSQTTRMAIDAARGYAALLAGSVELGGQAVRASAGESADVALAIADALRAPDDARGAAAERALRVAYDAHIRQIQRMRGYASMFQMTVLRHLDAADMDRQDT